MEAGLLALIISLVVTPIYTIVLAIIFYRCLKENPFKNVNKKREEIKEENPKNAKKSALSKGDKMDFAEAKEMKPIALEPKPENIEDEKSEDEVESNEVDSDEDDGPRSDSSEEQNMSEMARTGTISKKQRSPTYKAAPIPVVDGKPIKQSKVVRIKQKQELKIEAID